ncbi:glycosyltransferase family 2 protein [Bradyrhizobium sp. CCH5-F6]|jgi:glycosyltransferase involved in cell wall biosynthesis|uniref:glycosyltransferase family 2 protein n=1 Tax=Bradyrhizobium sp. CCH5-F6 TaxID=1768753 RepID=UPI00076A4F1F|nr:glycosyltransferase family 2 protein [Bradyrhizobium sp. CCH5-F6]
MGLDRRLMCLLPVRNGAVFLPRYFDCVRTFCSGIIALDDGSTDNTGVLLKAEPMVKALLTNCPRPSYKGWNDSQNRQRLLDACADFSPEWVIWIDADEVIPASDIPLLMHFIDTDARPEQVYGFEVLRMIGDGNHFDQNKLWVYRLFGYRPGYTLPKKVLHFEPVPVQIGRHLWNRTRLRIAHFAGLTAAMRRARYTKYLEADPKHEWQASYSNLLDVPGHIWELRPLPDGISLLIN